jgi:hypothetical protein
MINLICIKEFLETNYPRGRAIGVFRRFHFDLKPKNAPTIRDIILPHPPDGRAGRRGEVDTRRQSLEEFFRLKIRIFHFFQ